MNITSDCDVTNYSHQMQMTALRHWMKPHNENFLRTPLSASNFFRKMYDAKYV